MNAADAERERYDRHVAELEDDAFNRCAMAIVLALSAGRGERIFFQPGDITRYEITIAGRMTRTISSGGEYEEYLLPLDNTGISFGTTSDRHHTVVGHMATLTIEHPWTAAVWRRLLTNIDLGALR